MNITASKTFLFASGLIGAGIGAGLLLDPVAFEASAGIVLGQDPNLLSEVRAPGGALFGLGVMILLGAFLPRLAFTSALVSTVVFGSYGLARLLGVALDGAPGASLVAAMAVELLIAAFGLWVVRREAVASRSAVA